MKSADRNDRDISFDSVRRSVDEVLRETAIVILTWNQCEETQRCLQSLASAGYSLSRVVLWDNGSTDATDEAIASEFPDVIFNRHPVNLGVASGRNAAASLAIRTLSPSHLLFLDNDMVVSPGFLEPLCESFVADPRLAQALAKIRLFGDPQRLQSAGGTFINFSRGTKSTVGNGEIDRGQYDIRKPCLPSGGATLVSVTVFLELDGFDPVFDPYGTEDFDFSYRVRTAGYSAVYVPEAVVYHDYQPKPQNTDIGQSGLATATERWMILLDRHASTRQKIIFWVLSVPAKLIRAVCREVSRGNAAALKGVPRGVKRYLDRRLSGKRNAKQGLVKIGIESD